MRILTLIIETVTPMHCGSGKDDPVQDQPVARDAFGVWRVPGSSLAGCLRALAQEIDKNMAERMFGIGGSRPSASLIWCEDMLLLDYDGRTCLEKKLAGDKLAIDTGPFVRDHVRLDLERGAAIAGGKFDAEIVPPGARFLLSVRCDGWDRPLKDDELAFFDKLASLVAAGRLAFGGKTANGYGRYRSLECRYIDLDLFTPKGYEAWLNLPANSLAPANAGKSVPLPDPAPPAGAELCGTLELPMLCDGPVIIGGGRPDKSEEADILFCKTPRLDYAGKSLRWQAALPGSSLKGCLRHAVYRILRDLGFDDEQTEGRLNDIFGYIYDGSRKLDTEDTDSATTGKPGKIAVEDCALSAGAEKFVQHVALDRFTGGALDGALFSEQPFWRNGTQAPLTVHFDGLSGADAALIMHALLDLGEGRITVGSGGNRGNGRLRLSAPSAIRNRLFWQGQPVASLLEAAAEWDKCLQEKQNAKA